MLRVCTRTVHFYLKKGSIVEACPAIDQMTRVVFSLSRPFTPSLCHLYASYTLSILCFSSPFNPFVLARGSSASELPPSFLFVLSLVRGYPFNQHRWLQGPEGLRREQPLFTTPRQRLRALQSPSTSCSFFLTVLLFVFRLSE